MSTPKQRAAAALKVAAECGGTDGAHHKQWVIDQMVRALTEDDYSQFVATFNTGLHGPNSYKWEEGIAP